MDAPRLMSYADAGRAAGGLSESSLRRRITEGRFPQPIVLSRTRRGSPARVAFVQAEVEAAVAAWIAEARQPAVTQAPAGEAA